MMIKQALFATTVAISVGSISFAWADARPNPYTGIVERNPFGIKDPPPPPVEVPVAPIIPLAKVMLTGIISIFGPEPRALFEISEQEQGKPPTIKKPILKVGEREGSVEVISIDITKSMVRIKIGTVETNVVFEVAKASGPGGPSVPGLVPAFNPAAASASAISSPTIISPGGANTAGRPGSGVSLMGSTGLPAAAPVQIYQPASASAYTPGAQASSLGASGLAANSSFGVSTYGANDGTKANIPARPSRMDGHSPGMTLEELIAHGYTPPPTPGGRGGSSGSASGGPNFQPPVLTGRR